jgi:hypothetical protein
MPRRGPSRAREDLHDRGEIREGMIALLQQTYPRSLP